MITDDSDEKWKNRLSQWDFNVLDVHCLMAKGSPLECVGWEVIHAHDLVNKLNLCEERLRKFLRRAESMYDNHNPYHCSAHAGDVTANVHFLLESGIKRAVSPLEILALFVAAIGHDIGHFALNNAFLANSKHDIAQRYDYSSSLENFHLQQLQDILKDDECNFLGSVSGEELKRFHELVSALVLSTDMARHRDFFTRFQEWTQATQKGADLSLTSTSGDGPCKWFEQTSHAVGEDDRKLLLSMCIKCADLANVVKPLSIADSWAERIMEEFYAQGEREIQMNLPLTQFSSRENAAWRLAKHQLSFLTNVVSPLFESFLQLADSESRALVRDHAEKNTVAWTKRMADLDPGKGAN